MGDSGVIDYCQSDNSCELTQYTQIMAFSKLFHLSESTTPGLGVGQVHHYRLRLDVIFRLYWLSAGIPREGSQAANRVLELNRPMRSVDDQ
jgi:hypothetical protein